MYVYIYIQMVKPMVPQEFFYQKWLSSWGTQAAPGSHIQLPSRWSNALHIPAEGHIALHASGADLMGSPQGPKDALEFKGFGVVHLAAMEEVAGKSKSPELCFIVVGLVSSSSLSAWLGATNGTYWRTVCRASGWPGDHAWPWLNGAIWWHLPYRFPQNFPWCTGMLRDVGFFLAWSSIGSPSAHTGSRRGSLINLRTKRHIECCVFFLGIWKKLP